VSASSGPQPHRAIAESSFALVTNGFADGPMQALRDYLIQRRAGHLVTLSHPLSPEEGGRHLLQEWVGGEPGRSSKVELPSLPPLTYPLDLLVHPLLPVVDCWFGFNPLNVLHGLAARRLGRTGLVVYWGVDFVESRFGGGPLTGIYERLEGYCCRRADARFELTAAMRDGRDRRHRREGERLAPVRVVPMGGWTALAPKTTEESRRRRVVVYMGHLLPRQGLLELLEAIRVLVDRKVEVRLELIGRGSQEGQLRERSKQLGLDSRVTFRGFIEDHRELERLVSDGTVGVAPYATGDRSSFTAFADPGKLKVYLAAGLPIVTTNVAPVAGELAEAGAALLVDFEPAAIAAGIEKLLDSAPEWRSHRRAALQLAEAYDWRVILSGALDWLGFD
jgi:glycosyltransferase involved in cell wall biosynthesis